jgi:hypothetical protein
MRAKSVVVIEPPQRRAGKQQVLVPSADGRVERRDGGSAVDRVIAGVDTASGPGKWPRSAFECKRRSPLLTTITSPPAGTTADHVPDIAHQIPIGCDQPSRPRSELRRTGAARR